MPQSLAFSTLALLAVGGTASGVYLGRTAVAEIDPVHYSSHAPSRFYADMVPGGSNLDGEARLLPAADFTGLGDGCVNCRTYPEEYVPQHDGSIDAIQAAYPNYEPVEVGALLDEVDRQIAQIGRSAAVERYASYPVEKGDEQPVEVAAVAPAVVTSEPDLSTSSAMTAGQEAETPGI